MNTLARRSRGAPRGGDGPRLHLQDGPIDLLIDAFGPGRDAALTAAAAAFDGLLAGLAAHLPALRQPVDDAWPPDAPQVAQRMRRAVACFPGVFATPMAAVAGAVADEVLAAMRDVPGVDAAYVNNRGDIAVFATPARPLDVGIVAAFREAGIGAGLRIDAASGIGGVATSGWDGRSFSLGIADAVTILACDAATADAAATLIANAVDVEHPAIRRRPARELDPDSDLRDRLVTVDVGPLPAPCVDAALAAGAVVARAWIGEGRILGALLALHGREIVCAAEANLASAPPPS